MKIFRSATLGLAIVTVGVVHGDEFPNADQNATGYTAVVGFCKEKKISPQKITIDDYHYYDGALSHMEYSVVYIKDDKRCTQKLITDYKDGAAPKSVVRTDELEDPACVAL